MHRHDEELTQLRSAIAEAEEGICRLERQVDAAQIAGLPSHSFESTLRAARSLLSALLARRESLLNRVAREHHAHSPR